MVDNIIRATYENPESGLMSTKKLYEKLKHEGITYKQIQDFMNKQETNQTDKQHTHHGKITSHGSIPFANWWEGSQRQDQHVGWVERSEPHHLEFD